MKLGNWRCLPILIALCLTCRAAQNTPEPSVGPILRSTTHAVVLDVSVVDRNGDPVSSLTKDDFAVLENNEPQTIASFEISRPVGQGSSSEIPLRTVLLIDELNTQFVDMAYARYSVEKFLKRNGGKLDGPAQLLTLSDHGLKLEHDYTVDGEALLETVKHLPAKIPFRASVGQSEYGDRMNMSLGALEQIALANQKSGMRTVIVWVSPGYPVPDLSGFWPEQRDKFKRAVRNLSGELLDSRTTVYSIDPRGVTTDMRVTTTDQSDLGSSGPMGFGDLALGTIAKESGGRAFYGRNDVDQMVAASLVQGASFYTISYYPKNGNFDGSFRKIRVDVKKEKLSVATRNGYYAVADDASKSLEQVALEMKRAMVTPLAYKAIPVDVSKGTRNGKASMLDLKVDGNALQWQPQPDGSFGFHVLVGVAQYDADQLKGWHSYEMSGQIGADEINAKEKRVDLWVEEPKDLEYSSLRLGVCDFKTGLIGTVEMNK